MTAAPAITPPAEPQPLRRELSAHHSYELTLVPATGATLHLFESLGTRSESHDAAAFLTPQQIVELRADLASLLIVLQPIAMPKLRSEAGRSAAEMLRRSLIALVELEKVSGHEVEELYRALVAHIRSAKPYALQAVAP